MKTTNKKKRAVRWELIALIIGLFIFLCAIYSYGQLVGWSSDAPHALFEN